MTGLLFESPKVASLNHMRQEQREQSSATQLELQSVLESVRRAAEEVGVAQHSIYFREEAGDHERASRYWLWTTGVLGLLTGGLGVWLVLAYYWGLPNLSPAQSIQLALAKLLVFSVLFTGLLACGRIYRAHRHNFVINKHRQNALSTFETFVKAANDEPTKNAVLLQATQCIFAPQITGYVHQEQESGGPFAAIELMSGLVASQAKK